MSKTLQARPQENYPMPPPVAYPSDLVKNIAVLAHLQQEYDLSLEEITLLASNSYFFDRYEVVDEDDKVDMAVTAYPATN